MIDQSNLELYYNNINGLISKQDSLCDIVEMRKPDLIALCETKLHLNSTFEINGYETKKSNLKAGKEGILVAAKKGTFNEIELIYEATSKQIATVQISYVLRLTVVHGPQEKATDEEKEEFYVDLQAEVQRGLESKCKIVLVGDFNARLTHEDGELKESQGNGKRLKEMVDEFELDVLNIHPSTEGKWTRIQRKGDALCKSEIDYIITDLATTPGERNRTVIDEDKMYTPYRMNKRGMEKTIVFSDHCAITTELEIVKGTVIVKQPAEKIKQWKLTADGMDKYQELTSKNVGLGSMASYVEPFEVWRKKVESIMHQCFERKTIKLGGSQHLPRPSSKGAKIRSILREFSKQGRVQRNIIRGYQLRLIEVEASRNDKKRCENLKKTVDSLSIDDKLSPNAFWKMKKATSKRNHLKLPEVFKENGEITADPAEIKNEVRREFEHRLRNRVADPEWEEYVKITNSVVEEMLNSEEEESPKFTLEEMKAAMSKMKDGTAPDYYGMHTDIFRRSGEGLLLPLLEVFNIVRVQRRIPESWRRVLITMIYKNKGSHRDLEKYRGIFLTIIASKIFERMLQARMKIPLEKVSFFQSGSKAGKSAADNLFLLRSSMDHSKFSNASLFVTTYDFRQAFDSLWLQDCLLVLRKLGVEKYILKLINEMNKKAVVQVKTPYGLTEAVDVTDIVKQGGILGSPMCSATTAEYCEQNKGVNVGDVCIASLAFVDDIADLSTTFQDAVASHHNALSFAKKKKLQLAPDKCYIMLLQPNNKPKVIPQLEIDGGLVKEVESIVYLGDVFNNKGNNDDLVKDRVKRGTSTMISIQSFMRDTSLGTHTLGVYILLHNAILLPGMLFNSQAWTNLTDKNIAALTTIQLRYLKKAMKVRQAAANAFTFLELGVLPLKYEIHRRQLSFLHHIITLEEVDPVKRIWRYQTSLPEHGNWWSNVKRLLDKYSIGYGEDEIAGMSKETYKKKVKKAVFDQALKDLSQENEEKTRTRDIKFNTFNTQEYIQKLNPGDARVIFKCRSKTLSIKEHMSYKFSDTSCRWCGVAEETLGHIINCGKEAVINNVEEILAGMDLEKLREVAIRVSEFTDKVEV